jgi:hypothetical protein
MAMVDNRAVILARECHILDVCFFSFWRAEWAYHPCTVAEVRLLNKLGNHLMLPSDLRA